MPDPANGLFLIISSQPEILKHFFEFCVSTKFYHTPCDHINLKIVPNQTFLFSCHDQALPIKFSQCLTLKACFAYIYRSK